MRKLAPFLLLIILFGGAAWYSFVKDPDPVHELPPPELTPVSPVEMQQPQPQPEDVVAYVEPEPVEVPDPLPALDKSDADLSLDLAKLADTASLAEYIVRDQLISRSVAMIDSLTSRQVPAQINPLKAVDDTFIVETQGDKVLMSTANFARYDGYIALIQQVDTREFVKIYRRFYPLAQQAWRQNGGEGTFKNRLLEVIDQLLETPDVPAPVYLTKPEAVYLFAEPELEAMTAGQKILVRMGSMNAAVVKEKLSEIKAIIKPEG